MGHINRREVQSSGDTGGYILCDHGRQYCHGLVLRPASNTTPMVSSLVPHIWNLTLTNHDRNVQLNRNAKLSVGIILSLGIL